VAGRGPRDLGAYARPRVSRALAALLVAGVAAAAPPPNVAVTKTGGAVQEGGLARDPRAPAHLAIAYWDDRHGTCSVAVSSNGGATWVAHALPLGGSLCRNPVVAFGAGRTLYVAYEAARLSGFAQVELARSGNGGATFGAPVLLDPDAAGGGDHEPSIVAGTGGRVVVSFQRYDEDDESTQHGVRAYAPRCVELRRATSSGPRRARTARSARARGRRARSEPRAGARRA